MERYLTSGAVYSMYDLATNIPCEHFIILANTDAYGGGGIYNFYGISAANIPGASTRKTYSHEFGHLFVGLADEYVGGSEMSDLYFPDVEPWELTCETIVTIYHFTIHHDT